MRAALLGWVLSLCRSAGPNRSDWAFMRRFEVPSFDEPQVNYLTRGRLVQTPWFGIYLHKFDRPDSRPTLHDHPWPFASLVLEGGGYVERRGLAEERVDVRRLNFKRATDLHYIESLHSPAVWTLMLVGRRRRLWGYVDYPYDSVMDLLEERHQWTRYDVHPHASEFDAAMVARKRGSK